MKHGRLLVVNYWWRSVAIYNREGKAAGSNGTASRTGKKADKTKPVNIPAEAAFKKRVPLPRPRPKPDEQERRLDLWKRNKIYMIQ